jgi:hypothetical protein
MLVLQDKGIALSTFWPQNIIKKNYYKEQNRILLLKCTGDLEIFLKSTLIIVNLVSVLSPCHFWLKIFMLKTPSVSFGHIVNLYLPTLVVTCLLKGFLSLRLISWKLNTIIFVYTCHNRFTGFLV